MAWMMTVYMYTLILQLMKNYKYAVMRRDRSLKVILSLLQIVASKYMNDEGEMETLTNSDWAK